MMAAEKSRRLEEERRSRSSETARRPDARKTKPQPRNRKAKKQLWKRACCLPSINDEKGMNTTMENSGMNAMEERYALAMERIGQMRGEATVPAPYQDYFVRTGDFLLMMGELRWLLKSGVGNCLLYTSPSPRD